MRNIIRTATTLLTAIALNACDGPHEEAGEKADARNGFTSGESSIIAGPAEKAGEQRDRQEAQGRAAEPGHSR